MKTDLQKREARLQYMREYSRRQRGGLKRTGPALTNAQRQAQLRLRKKIARGLGAPEENRHRIDVPHTHVCVTPTCKKQYPCANICDPIDEGLKNSICNECFQEKLCSTV